MVAQLDPLKVLTAGALKEGARAAALAFHAATEIEVETPYTHGEGIVRDLKANSVTADIVGLPTPMIRDLLENGLITRETPIFVGNIKIAIAARASDRPPEIGSMNQFRGALTSASQLIYTTAPSGLYIAKVIEEMGLTEDLAAKTRRFSSGAEVNESLIGEAPAGALAFGVTTEIVFYRDKGVQMVASLPTEIEDVTPYEMAMTAGTQRSDDASQFLASLTPSAIKLFFASTGVE